MRTASVIAIAACTFASSNAGARGVSPYLPLHLEPEIERQIERVLILADKPILARPLAAATVLDALPRACAADAALCTEVRRYLSRFMRTAAISHASVEGGPADSSVQPIPNRHGLASASEWQAAASAYFQPFDWAFLSLGGVAYDEDSVPAGSVLSIGFDRAQLDIGYRGHWLSPFTDSSLLLSTEAQTMPSVTLSNYVPFTRFGLSYEAFLARMSRSDRIGFQGGLTSGKPRLFGMHVSMEPATGWSVGASRLMQYGGGARSDSFSDLFDAFFNPSRFDNVTPGSGQEGFGNQLAAFTSRLVVPAKTPFAVYLEYAGEDTSRGRNYLLGNAAFAFGIDFPRLWRRFDLTYEASERQNAWYVNSIYGDGLTNEGRVVGHWSGDQRQFGDDVGAQTHMARIGWNPGFGGYLELRYRTVSNESYSPVSYERGYDVTARYSRPVGPLTVGGEAFVGRDVFGEDVSRVAAFFRYRPGGGGGAAGLLDSVDEAASRADAEIFVDAGFNASEVRIDLDNFIPRSTTDIEVAPHFAIGARRSVSDRSDLGMRLEVDDIDGRTLLGARAVDYRYRFAGPLALSGFLGAARYDLATPAYGLYLGIGAQWRDLLPSWDLSLDLRYASKVARDHLTANDPVGGREDSFYDISSATLYVTRRFQR